MTRRDESAGRRRREFLKVAGAALAARDVPARVGATQIQHTTDPKVGTGYHYILLVGAADADVFGNPTPSAINAAFPEAGRKMVAMRVGERVNITTETGRCEARFVSGHGSRPHAQTDDRRNVLHSSGGARLDISARSLVGVPEKIEACSGRA